MRADKLVMLGVGAMGLYVVYRMFKTDGKAAQTTENLAPAPAPAPLAASSAPRLDPRQVLSNPTTLLLKAQTQYRMRLELGEGLPPFDAASGSARGGPEAASPVASMTATKAPSDNMSPSFTFSSFTVPA